MAKNERLNEEAALNNNLNSATLGSNREIAKEHKKPETDRRKKRNK